MHLPQGQRCTQISALVLHSILSENSEKEVAVSATCACSFGLPVTYLSTKGMLEGIYCRLTSFEHKKDSST